MIKQVLQEAFVLKSKGYYKHAVEVFYKALGEDNSSIEILYELAECYHLMHKEERALSYIEQVLDKEPTHICSLKLLKNIFFEKKAWQEAVQTAKNIYFISRESEDLVEVLELLNKLELYEEIFEYVGEISLAKVNYEKAFAKFKMNELDEALEFINKAIDEEVNNKNLLLKGRILYRLNRKDECVELLNLIKDEQIDSELLNFMGLIKQYECDFKAALKFFLDAIKKDSTRDDYYYNCASTYFKVGDIHLARKYYNMAISISPDNQNYHFALANLYYSEKQYKRAMEELSYNFFEANLLRAIILYDSGYLALSKKEIDKLVLERPDHELMLEYKRRIEEELSF